MGGGLSLGGNISNKTPVVLIMYAVIQTDRQIVALERIMNGALVCMSCCGLPVGGMNVTICYFVYVHSW